MNLSGDELKRYARHIILDEVGISGQERLKKASVLLVGCGGLGSPVALYLAASGIGKIGIVDFDVVDVSNLQRQILHDTSGLGRQKVDSAEERLLKVNPFLTVEKFSVRLDLNNANEIIRNFDVVVDGSDNFATRYLVNEVCVQNKVPNVFGSIFQFEGQATVFKEGGACYKCLFPEPPAAEEVPSCSEAGVLGVLPGMIGMVQATEVVKLILEIGKDLSGRLLLYNALDMSFNEVQVGKNPNCVCCGNNRKAPVSDAVEVVCQMDTSEALVEVVSGDLKDLANYTLVDVRSEMDFNKSTLPGAINIPLELFVEKYEVLGQEKPILLFCNLGVKSRKAGMFLVSMDYKEVLSLKDGVLALLEG